ncbi:MAG: hypothetical protein AAB491_02210 [Patescibacteria group bacterium]
MEEIKIENEKGKELSEVINDDKELEKFVREEILGKSPLFENLPEPEKNDFIKREIQRLKDSSKK